MRTKILLCFLGMLSFLGFCSGVEHEIEDFEFVDSEDGDNIIRRASVYVDDEDFLGDEAGSTPEIGYEGSGTTTVTTTTQRFGGPNYQRLFRVSISVTNLIYTQSLDNRDSPEFLRESESLKLDLEELFSAFEGQTTVTVLQYSDFEGQEVQVTFDLAYDGTESDEDIDRVIADAVYSGRIGKYDVNPEEFSIRSLEGEVQCPIFVGRDPAILPRNGTNYASLLVNNKFPCDGNIIAWDYYRIIPEGTAFVGVWRHTVDNEFVLISKTGLPSGTVGQKYVRLETPIPVKQGDFIGIFYPQSTPYNVIAQARPDDDVVAPNEFYQTYYAQLYNHMVQVGTPIDMTTVRYIQINSTFALRAIMDYTGIEVVSYTCTPFEFSCGDGYCINANYTCDGQNDCINGFDEENCAGIPTPDLCLEGRFRCDDGTCISRTNWCDGKSDCPDGSDERCLPGCTADEFTCGNGECIAEFLRCNQARDCSDGSDEADCPVLPVPCASNEYRCIDGSCISLTLRCNSRRDCPGGEDEYDCPSTPCAPGEFRCEYGQCIPMFQRCDQVFNCPDRTDELDCPCKDDEFTCQNGECIPLTRHCDAQPDCSDNSDEDRDLCLPTIPTFPPVCPEGFFRCAQGICMQMINRCNGVIDCPDSSDEEDCGDRQCTERQFRCDSGDCIDADSECNGIPDCTDNSDEILCVATCSPAEFTCNSGQCIDLRRQCDTYSDCADQSDEIGCPCRPDQFVCGDGQCIPGHLKCDRSSNCRDGSDERDCPRCRRNELECNDGSCIDRRYRCDRTAQCPDSSDEFNCTCNAAEFRCQNGQCIPKQAFCDQRRQCVDGTDESNCPQTCREDQFTCANGECIDRRRTCDGRADCQDRSDEQNCPRRCPEAQFQCDSGHCLDMRRRCDGRRDCPNGSDEVGCPTCSPADFTCGNSQCIPSTKRCDRRPDCLDGSDERGCPCATGEFTCVSDGRCLPPGYRCNGNPDCRDGSDEQDCVSARCSESEFRCGTGKCIDIDMLCDSIIDCTDGSDEDDCAAETCSPSQFTCSNGQCISSAQRCDRRSDCSDGSDETSCPCATGEFTCVSDGRCLPPGYRCNGNPDCRDGSDEQDCAAETCSPSQFTCSNGQCISSAQRCDRRSDCLDGSDETKCPCATGEFTCVIDGRCLPPRYRCNGNPECRDGSDEQDCDAATCSPSQFTCSNGQCISSAQRCDRRSDCSDGSDETNCPCATGEFTCVSDGRCLPSDYRCNGNPDCRDGSDEQDCACTQQQFRCSNGQCIPLAARCDRRYDCQDGSDERSCDAGVSVTISPQQMRKRVGTSASFICQVTGSPAPIVVWSRRTGGAMPSQAVDANGRLTIVNLRLEDAGDYVCQAISPAGAFEAVARLDVDFIGPPTVAPPSGGPCSREEATCSNGQCIPRDYVCDGEKDCSDGSDEVQCNVALPCEPNEFRCNNGRCAVKIWRCDGDDDCLDNSDESNCPTRIPGAPCQSDEFMCQTNDQCIPSAYQCDGEIDCQDRTDEIGCSQPSISLPPVPEISVEVNGNFTIICEAVGTPTPLIVWRLNWGNIPTGSRVTVTSVDGRGMLTVQNAIPEDAGAYTCEAINNRGSIFAIPDALIIVRRTVGICQPPRFNAEAVNPEQCIRCFCFGQSQTCYSSNLQLSQITLGNQVTIVKLSTLEPLEQSVIQYVPTSREFEVRDFNRILGAGNYYWSLPYQYLNKRLNSYGGELAYRVYYEVDRFDIPSSGPDVIISGNGITLHHRSQTNFRPRASTLVSVPLVETAWERSPDSTREGPISEYATREDLMRVLENVTSIFVRATYDNRQTLIRLGSVLLTSGVPQFTGLGRAVSVEECSCPTGYSGTSCEDCASGFYKVERGRYGRECIACNCNGHSNDCDPFSGICRNCRDNTAGPYCNECAIGYVGDPRSGRPDTCQPCPCPLITPENQFSPACVLDRDGDIICTACAEGYTGRRCERCANGYKGNPLTPGDRCVPVEDTQCDQRGSLSSVPDVVTRQCRCKPNVEGQYCNRCKPNMFYLSPDYPYGCLACFCMGVTQTCQSTTLNRAQISLPFAQSPSDVVLTDMMQKTKVSEGLTVDRQSREVVYRGFSSIDRSIRYWSLPQQFLGDKLTAYGGILRFTSRYRAGRDRTPVNRNDPVVEIGGNDITLVHRLINQAPEDNKQLSFSVPFIETQWYRMDGEPATREHLLMVLADLDFILIRATYAVDTQEAALSGVSLDIAESRETGQGRAYPVEQCACPRGYKGLSCEDCDTGYTRTGGGLYLGLCEPCHCNGHSSECDPESGVCRNCRHNTEGDHCERCSRGFHGNATRGSVFDCQKCPCPLTESPNQFSPECRLDTDGQVTCSACPAGHTGRRCERCAPGYQGNPNQPGDYCKLINVTTCDCDERGTVPNTLCDPNTQNCQCKNNVQGRRCSACKEGYFNLDRDNEMGCLKCFCSGVSTQCSSSSFYRDEIVPMLNADGTHNFQLTNQRLSRTISDGFTINADRSEITFSSFEGIQRERETLFFSLPPKFRGDKVSSYGGFLRFGLSYTTSIGTGNDYMDVDIEILSKQNKRLFYLHRPSPKAGESYSYDILLTENSFKNRVDGQTPSRDTFLGVLADIQAILIRATYHTAMDSVTLRDVRMEVAIPRVTGLRGAPEVESCVCPEGYTGLSCQSCAAGYLRVEDSGTAIGRCVRCNCNGHATSCDPQTGVCQNCQDNTVGDRCERCAPSFYGDPTAGTSGDCRVCACPLTIPSNQFSSTCFLDQDSRVTCDKCPPGYAGRDCGQCAPGYQGNPREPGGRCDRTTVVDPRVVVNPVGVTEPLGTTATFQCTPSGRAPFDVVWSRLDGRPLPRRATQGPGPNYQLTITNLEYADSARYVCQVTNALGTIRDTVTLTVGRPESSLVIRIEEPTTIEIRPGQTAKFICVAIQYNSAANYVLSWTKENGIMPSKALDQNGVLIIPNLTDSDLGTYICTGSEPGGVDKATATISFGDVEEPPTVRIDPRYLQLSEGDRAEFQCIAQGSPRPKVTWTKGRDGPLPDYVYTDETGLFRIDSVSMSDQAEYHCTGTNSEGSASVRTIIYVQQQSRVEVVTRRTNITAVIGQSEQLVCYVEGGNDVTLVWTKEGGLPIGTSQENGVLILTNIQPSFDGLYTCTGSTPAGIIGRATSRITVTGTSHTSPTARIEPARQTVGSGTTGSLRCIVTGEPLPTISWSRANGQLSSNHQVNGEFLRILQATMDDRGIYICKATNVAGAVQASAIVDIERREPPVIELYPDNQQVLSTGSNALFQCRVIGGIPAPVATWTRASGREFTSRTEIKPENGVIMFTSVTTAEQGEYLCSATNEVGTVTATASVRVEGPPSIQITPGNRITSIVGDRVNVECVGISDPTPVVNWKSGQRRRSDVLPEALDAGPGTARLLFESIQKGDEGQYICVATNERGQTEESVDIVVNERENGGEVRVSISGPEHLNLVVGQPVELTCSASGLANPRFLWRRHGNQPLPPGHSVRNGVLSFPMIAPEYAGEYICSVSSEVPGPDFSVSVYIIASVLPRLVITPQQVTVSPGQSVQLNCQPQGQGQFNVEWTKVDGQLSPQARESNGVLEIRQVTRADSGRYRCVATNSAGPTEGFADVVVLAAPVVSVTPKQSQAEPGDTVDITCNARGDPQPEIYWAKEDGDLPLQHLTRNGLLKIYNAQPSDSGKYICTARSPAGAATDYGTLVVLDSLQGPGIQRNNIGDRVEMECIVAGNIPPKVTWTRLGGLGLPPSSMIAENILIIPDVKPEDAGTYRCTISNEAGTLNPTITLEVTGPPVIQPQQDYVTAALGTPAQLRCDATGYPEPRISWQKKTGDLPYDRTVQHTGELHIPKVTMEDAGTYTCRASNKFGTAHYPIVLAVGAFVPYFQQNPTSYMTFPPLGDAHLELDILLSFRPEATDGLVFYNGQYVTGAGDFVCFGLQEQYPEFRFDMGSGAATIRGAQQLELNKWHTVHLKRNRKNGTMLVNDEPVYRGEAPGEFQGLDLATPLYLGNVPNTTIIPPSARFPVGFVGGISEFKVKGVSINLGAAAREIVSVDQYQVCRDSPCENGASCRPENSRYGYACDCPQGFAGLRCELRGRQCYRGACGSKGRCFNRPAASGFHCICPFGYTGDGCLQDLRFVDPAFNKTSFISYPTISDGLLSVRVKLLFQPKSLDDGIILYNAQQQDGRRDFIAIILKDQHLEFRFDTGSGPALLRSRNPLTINQWTRVVAERKGRDGTLVVNEDAPVNEQVEPNDGLLFSRLDRGDVVRGTTRGDKTIGLNLDRPLYLGGVDPSETISSNTGAVSGFVGCVGELAIGDTTIRLFENAVETANVEDCGIRQLCDKQPCLNNARCFDISPAEYRCQCSPQFTGVNCETELNVCITRRPCQNGGQCAVVGSSYRCSCPIMWTGDNCEQRVVVSTSIQVNGDGFVELNKNLLPHLRRRTLETISLTITTTASDGLFFWQGQSAGEQGDKDYLALALKDGFVEFGFELGSGPALIRSAEIVNDGFPHLVVVERLGRNGSVSIDTRAPVTGQSKAPLQVINVPGNLFFGGVPDLDRHTGLLFDQNFVGCLANVKLQNKQLDFTKDAIRGFNIQPCDTAK